MTDKVCCVCHHEHPDEELRTLGGRHFCAKHHERALEARQFRWSRAGLIETALTLGFVLVVEQVMGGQRLSTSSGVLLALAPVAAWLLYIYRQDRVEPEPPGLVLGVAALGALLTWAVVLPISDALAHLVPGLDLGGSLTWIAEVGIDTSLVVFATWLSVRYTVYLTTEFDEPIDALIYTSAAAVGTAFASNLDMVLSGRGLLAGNGSALLASNVLVTVAGVVPMALGMEHQRFNGGGGRHVALGFVGSVLFQGLLHEVVLDFGSRGDQFQPVDAILLASGLSLVVIALGVVLTARFRESSFNQGTAYQHRGIWITTGLPKVDWPVMGVALAMLAGTTGFLVAQVPKEREVSALGGSVQLVLPRGWVGEEQDGAYVAGPISVSPTAPRLEIRSFEDEDPDLVQLRTEEGRRRAGFGYRTYRVEERSALGDDRAVWSWFSMVTEPAGPGAAQPLPLVIRGVDVVLATKKLTIGLSGEADEMDEATVEKILSSMRTSP